MGGKASRLWLMAKLWLPRRAKRRYWVGLDPTPFVEERISLIVLRKLANDVVYAPDLSKEEAGSLRRIDRLLNGEYKDGTPMNEWRTE